MNQKPRSICSVLLNDVYSIQVFLILGFVIQVTVVSVLLVAISSYTQERSTRGISKSLRSAILSDIVQRVRSHMMMAPLFASRGANSFGLMGINNFYSQIEPIHKHVTDMKRNQPQSFAVYMWFKSQELFASIETADPEVLSYVVVWNYTGHSIYTPRYAQNYGYIDWFDPNQEMESFPYSFGIGSGWMERGESTRAPFWTLPYFDKQLPDTIFFTYFHPVYINETEYVGLFAVDYTVTTMTTFLRNNIKPGKAGVAYVMDKDGNLISHSDKRLNVTGYNPTTKELFLLSAARANNTLIAHSAVAILRSKKFDLNSDQDSQLTITVGRKKVAVQYTLYRDIGLDWILVVAIPEEEYLGAVRQTKIILGCLSSGIAVISILVSIAFSSAITIPLKKLGREMNNIAKMEFNSQLSTGNIVRPLSEVHTLRQQFRKMKDALEYFGRYVPVEVVKILLADTQLSHEKMLSLRNEEICIMFSDIENFTGISEMLPPEQLVIILEQYFREMSNIILQNEGTLDKYIGDAIMAFWNMPKRVQNYTCRGVHCALLMQRRLKELHVEWKENNLPILNTRIGLNAGNALVGNVGSINRVSYTAIGDSVNLASRIEGLNKYYGTYLLITENVHYRCKNEFICRPLDKVTVVGRKKAVLLYEVIDSADRVSAEVSNSYALYSRSFELYLAGQFALARKGFEEFAAMIPDDSFASRMIERCNIFELNPPRTDWDGVCKHEHK